MARGRWIQLVCLLLAGTALVGAGGVQARLDHLRTRMDLAIGEGVSSQYPELQLLQLLPGGVRMVLIHHAWIRSEKLKQQGKVFDAVQLADWICTLEARFPGAWGYQGWNLSYNISVEAHTPAERWYWVKAGIELLRDRGIHYNPKSLDLYRELGWIYFHKVGERSDDMHEHYKRYFAAEYHRVLGAPPHAETVEAYRAWLNPILDAPERRQALLADPAVAGFIARLASAGIAEPDLQLLDAYNTWSDDPDVKMVGQPTPQPASDLEKELRILMSDPALADPRAKVVAFARKHVLQDVYKLRTSWMRRMVEYYGPLDWRLAQTHSLYWTSYGIYHIQGLGFAELQKLDDAPFLSDKPVPLLNTHRTVLNSLKQMAMYGRISLTHNPADPDRPGLMEAPDWRFVEVCHREHIARKEHLLGVNDNRTYDAFIPGHVNFLSEALTKLYLAGRREQSEKYFRYVRDTYKKDELDWNLPLHDYVWRQVGLEGLGTRQQAIGLVAGLIEYAYNQGLAGYPEEMALAMDTARTIREEYDSKATARNKIPPMHQLQSYVAGVMIIGLPGQPGLPASVAMELYEMLPLNVQRALYDGLAQVMPERCQAQDLDFAAAFPEPEGMEAFRQRRAAELERSLQPHRKTAGVPDPSD